MGKSSSLFAESVFPFIGVAAMRIVIDFQGYQGFSQRRGIGQYVNQFVKNFLFCANEHEIIILLNRVYQDSISDIVREFSEVLPIENIKIWHSFGPCNGITRRNEFNRKLTELVYEQFILNLNPDILLITSMFEGHKYSNDSATIINLLYGKVPVCTILYDLIPLKYPEKYLVDEVEKRWFEDKISSLNKSTGVFCISESTRLDALKYLQINHDYIVNISSAVSEEFRVIENAGQLIDLKDFGINRDFLLNVGGLDERKNLKRLIKSYAELSTELKEKYQLVIVFDIDKEMERALHEYLLALGLDSSDVVFTGYVDCNSLILLYNLCYLFVFPSIDEGFGLPILEAMSCGAPCLVSNTSAMPEVIGDSSALFDPYSTKSMSESITKFLINPSLLNKLKLHSLVQAKKFSWRSSAAHALDMMKKIVSRYETKSSTTSLESMIEHLVNEYSDVLDEQLLEEALASMNPNNTLKSELYR